MTAARATPFSRCLLPVKMHPIRHCGSSLRVALVGLEVLDVGQLVGCAELAPADRLVAVVDQHLVDRARAGVLLLGRPVVLRGATQPLRVEAHAPAPAPHPVVGLDERGEVVPGVGRQQPRPVGRLVRRHSSRHDVRLGRVPDVLRDELVGHQLRVRRHRTAAPLAGIGPPQLLPERPTARVGGVDPQPRARHPSAATMRSTSSSWAARARPLPHSASATPKCISSSPLVAANPATASPRTMTRQSTPGSSISARHRPAEHVVRERVLVLREHPGQAGDRGRPLDLHHGRYVLGTHRPQHPDVAHGPRLGHPVASRVVRRSYGDVDPTAAVLALVAASPGPAGRGASAASSEARHLSLVEGRSPVTKPPATAG